MVWLDLPTPIVMVQVLSRTVSRRRRRQVLWTGNTESPLWSVLIDRDHIVRWRTRASAGERVRAVTRDRPDLPVVRLCARSQTEAWLNQSLRPARPHS